MHAVGAAAFFTVLLFPDEQRLCQTARRNPLPGRGRQVSAMEGAVVLSPMPPGWITGTPTEKGQVVLTGSIGLILREERTNSEHFQ